MSVANNYYLSGNPRLVSADMHATLIQVILVGTLADAEKHTDEYLNAVKLEHGNGYEVYTAGDVSVHSPDLVVELRARRRMQQARRECLVDGHRC